MAISNEKLLSRLRSFVAAKGSRQAAADDLDISLSLLTMVLNGTRDISNDLAKKLGFRAVRMFEEIRT